MCPGHSLRLKDIASHSFSHVSSNTRCTLQVYATWSLTSSTTFFPLQLHLVYFWTEAISETFLHSSIISSKINKLLPTPLTDNMTANDHPTMINLHTLTHPALLHSLTLHLITVLACCKTPHISCTPTPCKSIYQSTKVTNSDDPDLQPTNIILGHLPPADMLLNYHCSAFSMATEPTTEELNNAPQPRNLATTVAVNFEICQDMPSTNHLAWHPWWKQQILYCQISLHSNFYKHLQQLNQFPTQSWVPTLPCYQDYCCYWPPTCTTLDPEPPNVLIYHGHTQRIHPTPLDLQLRCLSQRKKRTPSLSSMTQAIFPSSSITNMALLNPTFQAQFNTSSRHKPASLWLQLMKEINGHVLTIPANSGANLTLSTMLLMTLTLFPLILLPDSFRLSLPNVDLTVFTVLGPYHILKIPSTTHLTKWLKTVFHFSGNNTITQNTHTLTVHQTFSLISILVSLVLSVLQLKCQHNPLLKTH